MKISVQGYKAISSRQTVELGGLTILAGTNSSGKSSFMQPILLIKQTLASEYDAGPLRLDGANVRLTDTSQIISRVPSDAKESFSVGIADSESETEVTYKFEHGNGVEVASVYCKDEHYVEGIQIHPNLTMDEIEAIAPSKGNLLKKLLGDEYQLDGTVIRQRCFLELNVDFDARARFSFRIAPAKHLAYAATRLIHVPGLRGKPKREYGAAHAEAVYPGLFEEYIASIIFKWKTESDLRFAALAMNLEILGMASAIDAIKIDDARLEIQVSRHLGSGDNVNIADVGFGVSQILPVLVALLVTEKDQIVYIEQPELHLHPRAQFQLAKIIAAAVVVREIKAVIETHSAILIRGVQTLVAKGALPAENVSLNWFTQDRTTGQTKISSAQLDKHGAYGDWPIDFDDVALDVDQEYLDAVEAAISNEI